MPFSHFQRIAHCEWGKLMLRNSKCKTSATPRKIKNCRIFTCLLPAIYKPDPTSCHLFDDKLLEMFHHSKSSIHEMKWTYWMTNIPQSHLNFKLRIKRFAQQ